MYMPFLAVPRKNVLKTEKWEEVCGEYDGPKECYSKWVKTSIRPLIDAVKENYDLCARLIIKEYCDVLLLD